MGPYTPSRNQPALALCCLSFGCSCAGPARRRAVASPHMYACKHTRWHILTRAALHRLAHEYLLPSTCLSSGLRAFTRLCFPTHACVAIVPIACRDDWGSERCLGGRGLSRVVGVLRCLRAVGAIRARRGGGMASVVGVVCVCEGSWGG